MQPYGERIPMVNWCENHGCPCCDSYRAIPKRKRKSSKVRARQQGKRMVEEGIYD